MWPFKKKKSIQKIDPKVFKTIICIPGNWKDWNEFIISIVGATEGEYIAAGFILINASKQKHYQIEFCERDDKMKEAVKYAGIVSGVSETFLNDNPTILPGQTFTPSPDSTVYRITNEIKQPSEGSALFENPFGIWRLTMANN